MDKYERVLPIGTVVRCKGGNKKVMITGYAMRQPNDEHIFDYTACVFPEGYMSADAVVMFDHEDIEHIYALGYQSEFYFDEFQDALADGLNKVKPFDAD